LLEAPGSVGPPPMLTFWEPFISRAPLMCPPDGHHVVLELVPLKPFPEESAAAVPEDSSNFHQPRRVGWSELIEYLAISVALGGMTGSLKRTMTVRGSPAAVTEASRGAVASATTDTFAMPLVILLSGFVT
jgi:hypothetical protein